MKKFIFCLLLAGCASDLNNPSTELNGIEADINSDPADMLTSKIHGGLLSTTPDADGNYVIVVSGFSDASVLKCSNDIKFSSGNIPCAYSKFPNKVSSLHELVLDSINSPNISDKQVNLLLNSSTHGAVGAVITLVKSELNDGTVHITVKFAPEDVDQILEFVNGTHGNSLNMEFPLLYKNVATSGGLELLGFSAGF